MAAGPADRGMAGPVRLAKDGPIDLNPPSDRLTPRRFVQPATGCRLMWFSKPIDLARQIVRPTGQALVDADGGATAEPGLEPEPLFDVRLALSRPELDRFAAALLASLGPLDGRLDSPARLAAAIDVLVAEIGGHGRTRVVRRPAGLTTPEGWEVDVAEGCHTTQAALDALARGLPLRLASDVAS